LVFFATIIFGTFKINKSSPELKEIFQTILNVVFNSFNNEEVEKFKNSIISLKKKYEIILINYLKKKKKS
jgi:hypothetical protein